MNAEERVKKTIRDHDLIKPGSRVLLGFSGGPDSLCLLHILCRLQKSLGFTLSALHVNHMLRGEDADADEAFAKAECEKLGVPITVCRVDVKAVAAQKNLGTEEAGRLVRYEAYKAHAGGGLTALAHNMDDQAETVLMRILRGTGTRGLKAMEYSRKDGVIRPLLDTPRSEIESYCKEKGLTPRIDKTNGETDYTRNRVRLLLMPELEKYNPRAKEALVRLAASASEDSDSLEAAAESFILKKNESKDPQQVILSLKELRTLDSTIFKRVMRMAAESSGGRDVSAVHLEALRKAVESGAGGKTIQIPGSVNAKIKAGKICFCKSEALKMAEDTEPGSSEL